MPCMGCTMHNKCEDCKKCKMKPSSLDKWRYTLYTTVLFLIIVNPYTYLFVNSILKYVFMVCNKNGCPTPFGIVIHAIVFTLLLRVLMDMDI